MGKISRFLVSEKIPTIVCATACVTSVLMGFMLGYMFFGEGGNTLAYADTIYDYQAEAPYMAAIQQETYNPQAENPAPPYNQPPLEESPAHLFVVTILDGFIVVYHAEKHGGGLKETTNTFVDALAPEEQERLASGIRIYTDEALARLLQDYGS